MISKFVMHPGYGRTKDVKTESLLHRFARPLSIIAGVIIVLAVVLVADSLSAARVEQRISQSVKDESRLATHPQVNVGGFPFAQVLITNEIPSLSINALDVDIKDLGIVNASTEIHNIKVSAKDAYNGELVGAQAELMKRLVSLDGVAMGQLLGMTDLDISNPYDVSPGGGVASEAQLSGTLPGMDQKSTAVVKLRLDGPTFTMEPMTLIDDAGAPDRVRDGYTLTFDTRDLPLAGPANLVQMRGGSIQFEAERRNITIQPTDLTPVETGDSEFTDYASSYE
ncbi:LmeA family phospholipid-binding protein [Corynebacterium sp. S7]